MDPLSYINAALNRLKSCDCSAYKKTVDTARVLYVGAARLKRAKVMRIPGGLCSAIPTENGNSNKIGARWGSKIALGRVK